MSLLPRLLLGALALHLATSVNHSALLVCLSPDGNAALELAPPGATRCADADCAATASASDRHSCHDIPVLSTAPAVAKTAAVALAPPTAALWRGTPQLSVGPTCGAARSTDAIDRTPPGRHRSVVLTL